MQMQLRPSSLRVVAFRGAACPSASRCIGLPRLHRSVAVRAEKDSYERIEAPVRGGEEAPGVIPDGGPPVSERKSDLDDEIVAGDGKHTVLGTTVSFPDAMRFNGAAPEIINGRLAMFGFVAAVFAELASGTPVAEQLGIAPVSIGLAFLLFSVASLIPILKGEPREGGEYWGGLPQFTSDAELINGRVAMLGFAGLLLVEAIKGSAVF